MIVQEIPPRQEIELKREDIEKIINGSLDFFRGQTDLFLSTSYLKNKDADKRLEGIEKGITALGCIINNEIEKEINGNSAIYKSSEEILTAVKKIINHVAFHKGDYAKAKFPNSQHFVDAVLAISRQPEFGGNGKEKKDDPVVGEVEGPELALEKEAENKNPTKTEFLKKYRHVYERDLFDKEGYWINIRGYDEKTGKAKIAYNTSDKKKVRSDYIDPAKLDEELEKFTRRGEIKISEENKKINDEKVESVETVKIEVPAKKEEKRLTLKEFEEKIKETKTRNELEDLIKSLDGTAIGKYGEFDVDKNISNIDKAFKGEINMDNVYPLSIREAIKKVMLLMNKGKKKERGAKKDAVHMNQLAVDMAEDGPQNGSIFTGDEMTDDMRETEERLKTTKKIEQLAREKAEAERERKMIEPYAESAKEMLDFIGKINFVEDYGYDSDDVEDLRKIEIKRFWKKFRKEMEDEGVIPTEKIDAALKKIQNNLKN